MRTFSTLLFPLERSSATFLERVDGIDGKIVELLAQTTGPEHLNEVNLIGLPEPKVHPHIAV